MGKILKKISDIEANLTEEDIIMINEDRLRSMAKQGGPSTRLKHETAAERYIREKREAGRGRNE